MKKYIFTLFAVAAVLSSCSKSLEPNGDINSGAKAITTIGASTEISTRAVVSSSDDTKVNWEAGDQLGVLGANSSSEARNLAYELTAGTGSTIGTFQNNSSDITTISAIMYPYQENATWDGTNSKLTCEIPSVQTAVKGSFDKNAAVMYSIGNTTDANLNFAVNFLKVTIGTGDTNIHSITISSPSTELSGKIDITSSSVAAVSSQSLKSVTLTAGKNQTFAAGDYYIAIMPSDIVTPTISIIRYEDGHTAKEYSKVGSGNLVFASGKNVKPILVNFSTIATATGREAVQLWADGPYWATFNVGVTDGQTTSYGGYYAWGGSQNKVDDHNTGEDKLSGCNDTATKLWGTNWRMPTKDEFSALISSDNCELKYNEEGHKCYETNNKGLLCTGKNTYTSNKIFLPAGTSGDNSAGNSYYWSSDPFSTGAYDLYIMKNFNDPTNPKWPQVSGALRTNFYHVRAVLE